MTEDTSQPVFEPGDIVYGEDPFKGEMAGRPWLILANHADRPFHGEQYIALTLTTKSWLDGLILIPADSWIQGGTPDTSRIVPWGVQSIDSEEIDHWQGRIESELVEQAIQSLIDILRRYLST